MQVSLGITSYQHPSLDINRQRCINWMPSPTGPNGVDKVCLLNTPGLEAALDLGDSGPIRALIPFNNEKLYVVSGNNVYRLDYTKYPESLEAESIGTLNSENGSLRVYFSNNTTQIMLVTGQTISDQSYGEGYIITPVDDTLTQITDTDLVAASSITYLDQYFIFSKANSSLMYTTAIADGSSIDALDAASAERQPDRLVAVIENKGELWAFGKKTIEVWINAANPSGFPFSQQQGAVINQGCNAAGSVVKIDNLLMWLDDRNYVSQSQGYEMKVIENAQALAAEFNTYETTEDAWAYTHTDRGHVLYVLTFPTAKKTWVYDLTTQMWHERLYWNTTKGEYEHSLVNYLVEWRGATIAGSRKDGQLYFVKPDIYKDGTTPIRRKLVTPHYSMERKYLFIHNYELLAETGVDTNSVTAGLNPDIHLRYSNDAGHTWSSYQTRNLGKQGDYNNSVRWTNLGGGWQWLFELTYDKPAPCTLYTSYINFTPGTV